MKKIITVCLLCLILCGCTVTPTVEVTGSLFPTHSASTQAPTDTATQGVTSTESIGNEATTQNPTVEITESENVTIESTATVENTGTVTPSVTPTKKPQVDTVVIENFDSGLLADLVRTTDWTGLPYGVSNAEMSLTNINTNSGKGLMAKLIANSATCQNIFVKNSKVVTAFNGSQKYLRLWVNNSSGGDMSLAVTLFSGGQSDLQACLNPKNAIITDLSGKSLKISTHDAMDMNNGSDSSVIIPDEFVGWVAFDLSKLVDHFAYPRMTNTKTTKEIYIDVRFKNGFTNEAYYVLDDLCLSDKSNLAITANPTPSYSQDPNQFEIIGPAAGSVDIYSGSSTNLLVGIDQFNRTFDVQVGERSNKEVGMFFWLWNGFHRMHNQQNGNYDATKIMEQYGMDVLFKQSSAVSPAVQFHFWGEPLWGYYDQRDEWVIRKQMELLTNAGVDFIVFDTTNGWTYYEVYVKVAKVISEMIKDGANPPKIAFYTHSLSLMVTTQLYNEFYKKNMYPETWYRMNGKPMIISYTTVAEDAAEAASRGDTSYNPNQWKLSNEILNFFHFKAPQWPSEAKNENGFPWIEWTYPQPMYANGRIMNVSVASHPQVPMSFSLTRGAKNWGRGYNVRTGKNVSADVDKGTFFQSQWDTVHSQDPDIVFVDGWNEWIAIKSEYMGEYMLCDAANKEYSRDIEMMKGGYNDAFYIQLIQNIRKYKGVALNGTVSSTQKSIDIFGNVAQWNTVNSVYTGVAQKSIARNHASAGDTSLIYTEAAARNNIQQVKVTRDANNFYFLIECKGNITGSGANYMNLFIGTGNVSNKGWNGYEYVINRKISGNTSEIWRLDSSFNGTKVGTARVSVNGKYMQIEIPRSAIGMQNSNSFYFKVADNVTNPSDIMDYYVSGKSFPVGRLSYQYLG